MIKTLRKIDALLLPEKQAHATMHFAPYIWLIYLLMFFISLVASHPIENSYSYATVGTLVFLFVYFNGYWANSKQIKWNILAILIIASFLAHLTSGASVFFVYAAAFCCRLGATRNSLIGLIIIVVWISVYSWVFSQHPFFYLPAIFFSLMVGGINIYQHDIDKKRQELILSQQEVKHLAKISERERIARDLHDLIGHTFSVITLKAELTGKLINKDTNKARKEIKELENISRDALKQIREVVTGYRTSDLNTELAHAKYVLQSNEILFEYHFKELNIDDSINKELAIILKELVTNILKHSQATKVVCNIEKNNKNILLLLKDDGVGFNSQSYKDGFGLKGIKERVANLAGEIDIICEKGSQFKVSIPYTLQ